MKQRGLLAGVLLLFLILGASCSKDTPAPGNSRPETGRPAPAVTLPSLTGGEAAIPEDFAGRAVYLLFFSAG